MKRITGIFITLSLVFAMVVPVSAKEYSGSKDWKVTFTSDAKMISNFKTSDMDDSLSSLQPGDKATFEVELKNEHSTTTDWYMSNKILKSMEDQKTNENTKNGAYTYKLEYKSPNSSTSTVLYDSETVGGQQTDEVINNAGEGLHEATDALEDFFYLDTLKKGQTGKVTLTVGLDGETQGNDYQDTLAELQMNFAVELEPETQTTTVTGKGPTNIVRTGDELRLMPYYIGMIVSGGLLLALTIYSVRRKKKGAGQE